VTYSKILLVPRNTFNITECVGDNAEPVTRSELRGDYCKLPEDKTKPTQFFRLRRDCYGVSYGVSQAHKCTRKQQRRHYDTIHYDKWHRDNT